VFLYTIDVTALPSDDSTALALWEFFHNKELTQKEIVDFITIMSEDKEYAKWEFEQLVAIGAIREI